MSDLVVTFGQVATNVRASVVPVMVGASMRTEAVAIGASHAETTYTALANDNCIDVLANAACWIAVGSAPAAVALASGGTATGVSYQMAAGDRIQFEAKYGDKVSVIQA